MLPLQSVLNTRIHNLVFPAKSEPAWSTRVERWYQLDAYAFALADTVAAFEKEGVSKPDLILLASPQASNETDHHYVQSGAQSPSKFVHTLPNIRSSSLCQMLEWSGPILCLANDPSTLMSALQEAQLMAQFEHKKIWIFHVSRLSVMQNGIGQYRVDWLELFSKPHEEKMH
jgi:hypothetical protein